MTSFSKGGDITIKNSRSQKCKDFSKYLKKIPQELGIKDIQFYTVLAKKLDIDEKTVLKYVYSAFPQNYTSKNLHFFIDAVEATVLSFITDKENFNYSSIDARWNEKKDELIAPFFVEPL